MGRWTRPFEQLSIRWRLMGTFGPLIVGVVVFQTLYFPARQAAQARDALEKKGRSIAQLVAHDVGAAFEFGDRAGVEMVLAGAKSDPDLDFLLLFKADGGRFAALNPDRAPSVSWSRPRDLQTQEQEGRLVVSLPLHTPGGTEGLLVAGFDTVRIVRTRREDQMAAIAIGLLILGIGLFLTVFVSHYVVRTLRRFGDLTSNVAEGDLTLTGETEVRSRDELGVLSQNLNRMVDNLRRMVDDIREASVQVASSAGQISSSAKLITQGAQSQAHAADETSSSMEEIAASIQTVASNAQSLATHVVETSSSITQMGASIEQVARSSATLASTVADASATIEQMTASTDQMAKSLESLAETVSETSATIEEMTSSIVAVARNAEVLSSAAGRASRTVSEMAGAVNEVAKIAEEADRISQRASEDAREGDAAVATTIQGMKTISETMENTARVITSLGKRSQEIGKILEVIEEIADQTNLLALNAAIEAARAGEAGRGFAVVADEVRKLAERSVEATKEIGEVIRQVQQETTDAVGVAKAGAEETKEGIQLADKAGLALRRIMESVTRSSHLMAEIASSTARQSKASAEVMKTVADMNAVTEQVTTAVKEQAAGSRQIREATENVNRIMAQVTHATKEQAAGGRQVRVAVENMNRIASQVGTATKEQAEGSRQIVRAVDSMNQRTQEVSHATAEQKRGGELVVKAMENISAIARDNLSTVEEMSNATANLARQAANLAQLIAVFRVEREGREAPSLRVLQASPAVAPARP